jgi:Putative beta-barrel porin-2, OmpL-like. bbp2
MKRLLLASTVSALFAGSSMALAQAVPTLDKVLNASGINLSGYIDAGYTHADRNVEAGIGGTAPPVPPRVFDNQNNSFALHQLGVTIAKQPKEGFGGLVNFTVGSDAQVIHSFPEGAGPGSSMFDVTQAYLQYGMGQLTVIAGKFTTLHGTEVIASTGNTNISRSFLFGAVPFTHTGVRATWALNDQISLIGGINNGWDQVTDANRSKTLELGATFNPIKPLTVTVSDYYGKEPVPFVAAPTPDGTRNSFNAVASYSITDPLSVSLEVLRVTQDNFPTAGGSTTNAVYNGLAGYVTYMFMPKWRGALRLETFDDKDGLRFGVANAGTKYREVTATVSYLMADNFEGRFELRRDMASNAVYMDFNGSTSKDLMTVGLQGIYKF